MSSADRPTPGLLGQVPPKEQRIAWILECGCEPMFEHCGQCDARRAARTQVEKQERVDAAIREVERMGYTVTPSSSDDSKGAARG